MTQLFQINDDFSISALNANAQDAVLAGTHTLPGLLLLLVALVTILIIFADLRQSYWWKLHSDAGVATAYLFFKEGERHNLAALRMFEQAEFELGKQAEFVKCEHPYRTEEAERFGIRPQDLPMLVIHWEGIRSGQLLDHTATRAITPECHLSQLIRNIIKKAPAEALPNHHEA